MATSPLSIFQDVPKPGDRRRSVRHKVHSPAYASFSGLGGGMVLDLSEIRDISTQGMCLQLGSPLEENRTLNIVLDLSETKTYINTTGTVIWTDASGRCGIQFATMPESSLRQLNSWLMFNTLTALTKTGDSSALPRLAPPVEASADEPESPQFVADAPTLNAIRSQFDSLRDTPPAALEFLADRARLLTRASGAAIALRDGDEMTCRASSGEAPGIGARFHVGSGFSGECVRTAKLQRCDDSETNPLVDRESCRALGIRSMVAVPVLTSGEVAGLLEVFSPHPYAFEESDVVALGRLTEIIAQSVPVTLSAQPETEVAQEGAAREKSLPRETIFLVAAIVLIVLAIGASITLLMRDHRPVAEPPAVAAPAQQEAPSPQPATLAELRRFADLGDPVAQFALGARYAQGDEVKQDYAEAVHWFEKAANQGHVVAQATLGAYYWAGRGVPEDLTKAYFWSVLARAGGDEASKYRVAALSSRMTKIQVTEAEQQANDWLRLHQGSSNAHLQR
jgi:putative methionine-R-sulfoxide reductase with GAF domain